MEPGIKDLAAGIDTVWVLLCAALVFFMEAGFAFLEAGFIRAKNSLNIVMKVFTDTTVGMLGFWAVGFGVMYGLDMAGIFGGSGFSWAAISNILTLGCRFMPSGCFRLHLPWPWLQLSRVRWLNA